MGQNDKKTIKKAPRFNDVDFVKRELTKDELKDLKSRYEAGQMVVEQMLSALVADNYRVTLKYDSYSESPACFIQQVDDGGDNAGKILTGRGRSALGAILEACYKHFIIFDAVWPEGEMKQKYTFWDA